MHRALLAVLLPTVLAVGSWTPSAAAAPAKPAATKAKPAATKAPPAATKAPPTATKAPPTATKAPPTATKAPPAAVGSTIDPAKERDLRLLLKITDSSKMASLLFNRIMGMFMKRGGRMPASVVGEMRRQFDPKEFVELLVPIYDKHYSHKDLKGLIAFYQSPLGKKMLAVMPGVQRESMIAGRTWGMRMVRRVQAALRKKRVK